MIGHPKPPKREPKAKSFLKRTPLKPRKTKVKAINVPRATAKAKEYKTFLASKQWKDQRQRVFVRDGFRCTAITRTDVYDQWGNILMSMGSQRCVYTKDDGPLHGDHLAHGTVSDPRIESTPDEKITTRCPRHNLEREQWKIPRRMALRATGVK